jgi:uracil-DNA glycosylase family 4
MAKYRPGYGKPPEIYFRKDCTNCQIGKNKKNNQNCTAVGGAGPPNLEAVELIVISDHPGFYEEEHGVPFVHKQEIEALDPKKKKRNKTQPITRNAGALIREMLNGLFDLNTYEQVYMTNILKCDPKLTTVQNKHYRACSFWLKEEIATIDKYRPEVPILLAGKKALDYFYLSFPEFAKWSKAGIRKCRRRKDIRVDEHPVIVTFNPAQVARSEPRIEEKVERRSKRVEKSRWLYPPLPGSPPDMMINDLLMLEDFL